MTVFTGTSGDDSILGTSGGDDFHLEQGGEDSVSGGAGIDAFYLGATFDGGDRIEGGADKDYLFLSGDYSAGVAFTATTLVEVEAIELAAGLSYAFSGLGDANVGAGLLIDGHLLGASDDLTIDASGVTVDGLSITGGAGRNELTGGDGDDILDAHTGALAILHGGKGGDSLGGSAFGADLLGGGQGNDSIAYGAGAAQVSGGEGNDLLFRVNFSVASSATVDGGAGNDKIDAGVIGAGGVVLGGAGDDFITVNGGLDATARIDAGEGDDTLLVAGTAADAVEVGAPQFVGFGHLAIRGSVAVTLDDDFAAKGQTLEIATSGAIHFDGSREKNANLVINTADGDDSLIGGGGDDTFAGGKGSDTLVGGKGDDVLGGGFDSDRLVGGAGDDILDGGQTSRFTSSADTLIGGTGNDQLTTDGALCLLQGGGGDDLLIAHGQASTLAGGGGDDTIEGAARAVGGLGQDQISGNVAVYNRLADSTVAAPDQVNVATIDLSHIDADTSTAGDQAFHLVDSFTGAAGELVVAYDSLRDTSAISGDVNGDGLADFEIDAAGHFGSGGFVL